MASQQASERTNELESVRKREGERVEARAYYIWMYMTFGHTHKHILNCSPQKKLIYDFFTFAVRSTLR